MTAILNTLVKDRRENNAVLFLLLLVCFVIAMSFFVFSKQSLRLDEAQSLWQTSHTPARILKIVAEDVHVPLYHYILHFWQSFFGNDIGVARLLSLVFFIFSIPALYMLGKRAFGYSIALFATLLFALSPFLNWYGNEIRMYTLFALMVILNQYFFLTIQKKPDAVAWAGYFVTVLLGVFTHYFFFFHLCSQALFFLVYRKYFPPKTFQKFLLTLCIVLVFFAPWLYYVFSTGVASNSRPLLHAPTSIDISNTFSAFIFGFQNDHLNTMLVSLWPITVLFGFLALRENGRVNLEAKYFMFSFIVPFGVIVLLSVFVTPVYVSRYLIFTVPSLYIFLSWVISMYPRGLLFTTRLLLAVAMVSALTAQAFSASIPVKENYREVAGYLTTRIGPDDSVIVSAPFTVYPLEYYYRGTVTMNTLPIWDRYKVGPVPPFVEENLSSEVNTLTKSKSRAWLLLSYDQGYQEKLRMYFDTHFERLFTKNFSKDIDLYVYKLRYDESKTVSNKNSR